MPRLVLDIYHGERGIDLAEWKRRYDLWGVIVKCGGSDDRKWGRYEETTWVEQVTQAHALGLHVGAYYYSNATTTAAALADAQHCVNQCMRGMEIDIPIYLDIEERSQLELPMYQLTAVVTTFCNYVRAAGYDVGIYSNYYGFTDMFESDIAGYSLWAAAWRTSWPIWAQSYDLWQEGSMDLAGNRYHREGEVDGAGKVDLDWASDAFVERIENGGASVAKNYDPANEAAEIHAFMCTDPRFGYSQDPRWGGDYNNGEIAVFTSSTGHTYHIPCGSYDCSSSTTLAWRLALSNTKYAGCLGDDIYERTASMQATFCNTGLFRASLSNAKRGDLYLTPADHVAMCQDGSPDHDILSEFNRDENHAASGGRPGDQDGGESVIRGYYNRPWKTVLHYVGGLLEDITDTSDDSEVTPMGGKMIMYHSDSDKRNMLWDGCFDHMPYHLNAAEKEAMESLFGLKLQKITDEQAAAILNGCKARKAWREQGIAQAIGGSK